MGIVVSPSSVVPNSMRSEPYISQVLIFAIFALYLAVFLYLADMYVSSLLIATNSQGSSDTRLTHLQLWRDKAFVGTWQELLSLSSQNK